nr:accessory gland protein Acp63F-like isoform X4 [Drosophila bipectinata]
MRKLAILFLIALSISGGRLQSACKKAVPSVRDPHCGLGNKCHFNGFNKWVIEFESCRRKEQELPDFIKVIRGMCPKGDKPPCPSG